MDVVFGGFGFGGEVLDEDVFVDLAIGGDGFVDLVEYGDGFGCGPWWTFGGEVLDEDVFVDLAIGGDGFVDMVEYGDGFVDVVFGGCGFGGEVLVEMFLWV